MESLAAQSSRRTYILLGVLLAGLLLSRLVCRAPSEPQVEYPATCAACGYVGKALVGETPSGEQWPRECPQCHKKSLYMAGRCLRCGKPVPLKDPQAERFGTPQICPHCNGKYEEP